MLKMLHGAVAPSLRSARRLIGAPLRFRGEVLGRLDGLERALKNNGKAIANVQAQVKMYGWQLYRAEGEMFDDARKRFYRAIPEATGSMRLQQVVSNRLLRDFHELCQRCGADYWMLSGTLIGAVRHGGFIPWDDDVDLGMPRAAFEKLRDAAEKDDRFKLTELFDYWCHSRQVRFRYADERIPCFLDVFIFDFSQLSPAQSFARMQADRKAMTGAMAVDDGLSDWNDDNPLVEATSPLGQAIDAYFNRALDQECADGSFLVDGPENARTVMWGIDNLDSMSGNPVVFPVEDVYPLQLLAFEDAELRAPSNPEAVLNRIFGDYLDLPGDIVGSFEHVSLKCFEDPEVQEAVAAVLDRSFDGRLGNE